MNEDKQVMLFQFCFVFLLFSFFHQCGKPRSVDALSPLAAISRALVKTLSVTFKKPAKLNIPEAAAGVALLERRRWMSVLGFWWQRRCCLLERWKMMSPTSISGDSPPPMVLEEFRGGVRVGYRMGEWDVAGDGQTDRCLQGQNKNGQPMHDSWRLHCVRRSCRSEGLGSIWRRVKQRPPQLQRGQSTALSGATTATSQDSRFPL